MAVVNGAAAAAAAAAQQQQLMSTSLNTAELPSHLGNSHQTAASMSASLHTEVPQYENPQWSTNSAPKSPTVVPAIPQRKPQTTVGTDVTDSGNKLPFQV